MVMNLLHLNSVSESECCKLMACRDPFYEPVLDAGFLRSSA